MSLDTIVTGLIYLAAVFLLFYLGKLVYGMVYRSFNVKHELVENDNFALALAITGYYLGLVIALGGVLAGPSHGVLIDLVDILVYGCISIVLLNVSMIINDKLILHRFDNKKELIEDRNAGTGAVEFGSYVATGLMISGAISGQNGGIDTALVFWALGQIGLIIGGLVYNAILPFNLHDEIEKDNVAVGVAFGGVLIGIGNILRTATTGDFYSWEENLLQFAGFLVAGYLLLPVLRYLCDMILLPGRKLTDELVNQEHPNVGAGLIEAFAYVAASFLISWVL